MHTASPTAGASTQTKIAPALAYPLLFFTLVFAGLTGHDPWKADEAYVFGVVQHMVQSSDWLVPTLAGEPFMEKPPLFYWVAAGFARGLSPWLPLHDGARIASGFLMLLNLWVVGAAANAWSGQRIGRYAMLALVACFGMLVQSHLLMPDVSLLTGFALTALGFALVLRQPARGGVLIGLGTGIGFLSKGLIAPGVIGITSLVLPVCFMQWRDTGGPERHRGERATRTVRRAVQSGRGGAFRAYQLRGRPFAEPSRWVAQGRRQRRHGRRQPRGQYGVLQSLLARRSPVLRKARPASVGAPPGMSSAS